MHFNIRNIKTMFQTTAVGTHTMNILCNKHFKTITDSTQANLMNVYI
jgi:hypothetical protein